MSGACEPFVADPKDHEGNSFIISKPNGTSIQFVTERREAGARKRFLVYYEAKNFGGAKPKEGLSLRKTVRLMAMTCSSCDPICR